MRVVPAMIGLAALTGCGPVGGNDQTPQSDRPAGNQSGAGGPAGTGPAVTPGLWRNTAAVVEIVIPNLPPGATPPRLPPPATTSRCIGPEEAVNPTFGLLAGNVQAGCRTESFSYNNGRIEGVATCNAGGAPMRMTMNGQFGPTTYVLIIETRQQTQAGPINTRLRVAGDRIGECSAN